MKIEPTKSLIREIAPGIIVIGNNPFAPLLKLDDIALKADIMGQGVLLDGALDNITGESLDYDSAEIDVAIFANRPTALGVPMMISGDLDYPISQITEDIEDLDDKIDAEETARSGNVQSIDARVGIEETSRGNNVTSLDTRVGIEETSRGNNVTSLDTRVGIEETSRGGNVVSIDERFVNLPTGGGSGITEAQANSIAIKWAIVLG